MPTAPRGVRNNNPGNIDYHARNNWVGQVGIETGVSNPRFARFDTMENGIRALGKLLQTYFNRGQNTVLKIIGGAGPGKPGWAPPSENDTAAYASAVARALGVGVNDRINVKDPTTLRKLTEAIIRHENGGLAGVTLAQIAEGVRRALGGVAAPVETAPGNSGAMFPCPHCAGNITVAKG